MYKNTVIREDVLNSIKLLFFFLPEHDTSTFRSLDSVANLGIRFKNARKPETVWKMFEEQSKLVSVSSLFHIYSEFAYKIICEQEDHIDALNYQQRY